MEMNEQKIKDVLDFKNIASSKQGERIVTRCPFHSEKTPSMAIKPADLSFHCFGCGRHGELEFADMKAGTVLSLLTHDGADGVFITKPVRTLLD